MIGLIGLLGSLVKELECFSFLWFYFALSYTRGRIFIKTTWQTEVSHEFQLDPTETVTCGSQHIRPLRAVLNTSDRYVRFSTHQTVTCGSQHIRPLGEVLNTSDR